MKNATNITYRSDIVTPLLKRGLPTLFSSVKVQNKIFQGHLDRHGKAMLNHPAHVLLIKYSDGRFKILRTHESTLQNPELRCFLYPRKLPTLRNIVSGVGESGVFREDDDIIDLLKKGRKKSHSSNSYVNIEDIFISKEYMQTFPWTSTYFGFRATPLAMPPDYSEDDKNIIIKNSTSCFFPGQGDYSLHLRNLEKTIPLISTFSKFYDERQKWQITEMLTSMNYSIPYIKEDLKALQSYKEVHEEDGEIVTIERISLEEDPSES